MIAEAEECIWKHKEDIRNRQAAGETITSSMRQKAILLTFRTVANINAETLVSRHYELKALIEHFKRVPDPLTWSIPHENIKPTMNWNVEWTSQEDSRLLVGIWKYGFGSWEQMANVRIASVNGQKLICRTPISNSKISSFSRSRKRELKLLKAMPTAVFQLPFTSSDAAITYVSTLQSSPLTYRRPHPRIRRESSTV